MRRPGCTASRTSPACGAERGDASRSRSAASSARPHSRAGPPAAAALGDDLLGFLHDLEDLRAEPEERLARRSGGRRLLADRGAGPSPRPAARARCGRGPASSRPRGRSPRRRLRCAGARAARGGSCALGAAGPSSSVRGDAAQATSRRSRARRRAPASRTRTAPSCTTPSSTREAERRPAARARLPAPARRASRRANIAKGHKCSGEHR